MTQSCSGPAMKGRSLVLIASLDFLSGTGARPSHRAPASRVGTMPADVYRGDRQNMLRTPQVRLTPFAQLSLDHLKDARSRQFVPEGVAKSCKRSVVPVRGTQSEQTGGSKRDMNGIFTFQALPHTRSPERLRSRSVRSPKPAPTRKVMGCVNYQPKIEGFRFNFNCL